MEEKLKELLKQRFNKLYPNCVLYQINLSHPTFSVFYKEDNGLRHIDRMDNGVWEWGVVDNYKDEGGNIESDNLPKTKQLFERIDYNDFAAKATELSYKDMDFWVAPF